MSVTLADLRVAVLDRVGDAWMTPTDVQHALGLGGSSWYFLALVMERLANEGEFEIAVRGRVRRFRRARP